MSVNLAAQTGRHSLEARGAADCYDTPVVAVEALLRVERLPHYLWEPAAGHGNIVNVLRGAGHVVLASDLFDYGEPTHFTGRDFLKVERLPDKVECIVTNPPFRLAEQFVGHALDLCPRVVMLLRLSFLESERRRRILEERGLARVHIFRNRLPMMHRDSWTGPKASSAIAYAWFCWDRGYRGPATLHRISWKKEDDAMRALAELEARS
jgi:hypothetical protein